MQGLRVVDVLDSVLLPPPKATDVATRFFFRALELARDEGLGQAQFSFAVLPLDTPPSPLLRAGGEAFHAPRLLPESGELTALAFGVCTLGPAISSRIDGLFEKRSLSLALALDRLGNQLLREASRRLQDRLLAHVRKRGLSMAGELRAGDPGLSLEAQPAVLKLAGGAAIGVGLTRTLSLKPVKSSTVLYGVGRDLPPADWSRCDDCRSRKKCGFVAAQSPVTAP